VLPGRSFSFSSHDVRLGVELDHLVAIAAGDEQVAVGQRHDFMWVAGDLEAAQFLAIAVQFHNTAFALEADEVVAVRQLAGATELVVQLDLGRGGQLDFLGDLACAIHFDDAAGAALDQHHVAIGQGLAGMNLDLHIRRGLVFPHDLFVGRQFQRAADEAEENVPIRQLPAVLRALAVILPLDLALLPRLCRPCRRHSRSRGRDALPGQRTVAGQWREQ